MLPFGLFLDQPGRFLQFVAGLVNNQALNLDAGGDKQRQSGQDQGQEQRDQRAAQSFRFPGQAQGDSVHSFEAAGMGDGILLLQAQEQNGIRWNGLRGALKFQGGRQPLFQPQPRFRQPGGVHRRNRFDKRRHGAGGDAQPNRAGNQRFQWQPVGQQVQMGQNNGNQRHRHAAERAATCVAHPTRQPQAGSDLGQRLGNCVGRNDFGRNDFGCRHRAVCFQKIYLVLLYAI